LFQKYNVLSEREIHSRLDIYTEQYCAVINLEARVVTEMAKTMIYPAAARYLGQLAEAAASLKAAGLRPDSKIIKTVQEKLVALDSAIDALETEHAKAKAGHDAKVWCNKVVPAMLKVRQVADDLEGIVADDLWPLPTYQEMLFIK